MTGRRRTDWNLEPTDVDGIAVPYDEKDTEGHGILPNPTRLAKSREFASKVSDDPATVDGLGPVQGDDRA